MNSTNPSPNPTPSPLVPQGSIAPKPTSRSARVLLIGLTVASLHVVGLGLVLLQGCGKDPVNTAAASADTNTTSAPLTLPTIGDTNTAPSYYTSATSVPPAVTVTSSAPSVAVAPSVSNTYAPPVLAPIAETPAPIEVSAPTEPEKEYKIVAGDNLSKIASKNKVSLSALLKSNPSVDPKKLKVGQVIKVPAPTAAPAMAASGTSTPAPMAPRSSAGTGGTYKVKAGDNLTKIAKAHGITVNQLRAANNLKTTQVTVGRTLKIPARATAAVESNTTQH